MRVCMRMATHPKYSAGGAERQLELIGRYLIKKNVDIHYVINRNTKDQKNFEILNGIKVHTIGKIRKEEQYRNKKDFFQIINSSDISIFFKYLFKFNFDIYQLRGGSFITGVWAFFAKIIKKKKFVYTAAHIWDCFPNNIRWNNLTERIYRYGVQNADIVIVLAKYMKSAIDKNYGVNSIIIKSGHPVPNKNFKKEDPPLILWISRLVEWKRPELFLEVVKELKHLNANFLLIGPGVYKKKEILEFSKKYINFTYIPGVKQYIDNYYYSKASLLINTSSIEGFPNSFIQAWMYYTPVISLNVDPDCDICKNNLGYHSKGNFDKFVDKIKEFIESPNKVESIGKNCRNYAILNHDIKKTSNQYYSLYKMLAQWE